MAGLLVITAACIAHRALWNDGVSEGAALAGLVVLMLGVMELE